MDNFIHTHTPPDEGSWLTLTLYGHDECSTLKHDRSVVAQDAIEIIHEPKLIPTTLMEVAGKFFRRFDRSKCTFVSNIKEYYPDD